MWLAQEKEEKKTEFKMGNLKEEDITRGRLQHVGIKVGRVKGTVRPRTEGVEVQPYSFFILAARWGEWSTPLTGRFTPEKDPVPIVQEAGWAPGPVWTGAENLAYTGIRSPDRPTRSESLYRLSYPGPQHVGIQY